MSRIVDELICFIDRRCNTIACQFLIGTHPIFGFLSALDPAWEFTYCQSGIVMKIFVEKFSKVSILLNRVTHQKGKGGRQ